jgi:hypothetical protein
VFQSQQKTISIHIVQSTRFGLKKKFFEQFQGESSKPVELGVV